MSGAIIPDYGSCLCIYLSKRRAPMLFPPGVQTPGHWTSFEQRLVKFFTVLAVFTVKCPSDEGLTERLIFHHIRILRMTPCFFRFSENNNGTLVLVLTAFDQPRSQGLSLPAVGGGERETLGTRLEPTMSLENVRFNHFNI